MLPLALPKQEGGPPSAPPPSLDNPIEEEEMIVQVYATDSGNVSRIIAALKTGDVELGSRTEDLIKFLKEHKAATGGKSAKIKLECVEGLNYQYVIQMMDTARRVGYDQISPTLLGGGKR
jgi:biopolymer transport protein ExbD